MQTETEMVDWIYDHDTKMYINRWDKSVTLPEKIPKLSVLKPETPEEINNVLNDIAIRLRARKKI